MNYANSSLENAYAGYQHPLPTVCGAMYAGVFLQDAVRRNDGLGVANGETNVCNIEEPI